jgi:hypothetical protein
MIRTATLSLLVLVHVLAGAGCARQKVAEAPAPRAPVRSAPSGPTRTDFKEIAQKLLARCVAGGWISEWRSRQPDVDVAKPKVHLRDFEDKTGQKLDPTYLNSTLAQRMRLSGVYELVDGDDAADFIGRGQLLRLAERGGSGERFSVYTAVLNLVDPKTQKTAYSCEATVKGEL